MSRRLFAIPATLALGAGLLIGATQASSAAEIVPAQASAGQLQTPDASQSDTGTTPDQTAPMRYAVPPLGTVGFGWG